MSKQILRFKSILVFTFGLSLLFSGASVWADDNQSNNGSRYYYQDGQWYEQGKVHVTSLSIGSIVKSLPPQYTSIFIENNHYYFDNILYYMQLPDSTYVVVPNPSKKGNAS